MIALFQAYSREVAKYVFDPITKGLLFLQVKNRILLCGKNCSQVTLLYKFSLPVFQFSLTNPNNFFKHIWNSHTTRAWTGLCLGKLNFRAFFPTDMEASLRNEPIKTRYKISKRKIKRDLKVKNTIFGIF